jgi:hypothetical protein
MTREKISLSNPQRGRRHTQIVSKNVTSNRSEFRSVSDIIKPLSHAPLRACSALGIGRGFARPILIVRSTLTHQLLISNTQLCFLYACLTFEITCRDDRSINSVPFFLQFRHQSGLPFHFRTDKTKVCRL